MKKSFFVLCLTAGLLAPVLVLSQPQASETSPAGQEALVARGRYITQQVAMCVQCHTPRDEQGNLIQAKIFQGGPIPVTQPPYPDRDWALVAPSIAGLVGYTDEQAIRLLTTGIRRDGTHPRAPMPPFRMTTEDARAVIAYLRTLP